MAAKWRDGYQGDLSPWLFWLGVDRYVFFRADTDTDYYRSSRPITDIFEPIYVSGVKMKMNAKINNNKSSDKKTFFKCF